MLDENGVAPVLAEEAQSEDSESPPQSTARTLGRAIGIAALATGTAACGGGDSGGGGGGGPITGGSGGGTGGPTVLKPQTDQAAARFLLQASLSASTGQIAAVRDQGYEPWLSAQMRQNNDQSAEQFFAANGYDVFANGFYFNSGIGDDMIWSQLMTGGNGVRKRVALALSEFFVVSLNTVDIAWRSQAMGYYWDTLNRHAFGNFRDLLEAISLNPAMGVFLNTRGNRKADPASGRVPDENFGREIMQLFSIGLYELNPDGTLRAGPDGGPIETYDNDDVTGIAKAFTGYNFDMSGVPLTQVPGQNYSLAEVGIVRQPMTADSTKWRETWLAGRDFHSDEEKSFLGTTIPAGTNAADTLRITMDALFNHPNVGPFFGKQMIQRLVTSNPSPDYVRRVAAVFDNNGSGRRGDLTAVFKAILMDDEALSEDNLASQQFGKLREPMVKLAQWARTFGARSESGAWDIGNLSDPGDRLGQAPLRSPSVFNFFRPGYVPLNSQTAAAGQVAPEMQLVNETSVAGFVNFMERMVEGRGYWARDVKATYANELPIAHDAPALLDHLDLVLTAGQLSDDTRATILGALEADTVQQSDADDVKLRRIHAAVFMVMISNDYSVQR